MKKLLITVFLLLTSTITIPSNVYDTSIQQSSGSVVPAEVYQAIDELDHDKLASILALAGPLSKEATGLPLLTLYKFRDKLIDESLSLKIKILRIAETPDVKEIAQIFIGISSFSVGVAGLISAQELPDLTLFNRLLLSIASLGSLVLGSYVAYIFTKELHKKIADMKALIEPFDQKLDIVKNMIDLLENHPES